MITETIILEVTGVSKQTWYPNGYTKPSETLTMIQLTVNVSGQEGLRSASVRIPGDLPLGTRFKLNIEQLDDVTAATIHRGALPIIDDSKQLRGTSGDVQ